MAQISFKTKIPKGDFEYQIFEDELVRALKGVSKPEIKALFKRTTEGWDTKVNFRGTVRRVRGRFIRLTVRPFGETAKIYNLVNEGAKPHLIAAKNIFSGGRLQFRPGYSPSTSPGILSSRKNRSFGPMLAVTHVNHPGFKGRKFDEAIAKAYEQRFFEVAAFAIDRATRRQAHSFD